MHRWIYLKDKFKEEEVRIILDGFMKILSIYEERPDVTIGLFRIKDLYFNGQCLKLINIFDKNW